MLCVMLTSCPRAAVEIPSESDDTNRQAADSTALVKSGPQTGETVDAFQVVKVGGIEDGVQIDEQLCYR
jgi:hypothetical protein